MEVTSTSAVSEGTPAQSEENVVEKSSKDATENVAESPKDATENVAESPKDATEGVAEFPKDATEGIAESTKDATEGVAEDSKLKGTEEMGSPENDPDVKTAGESTATGTKEDTTGGKKRKAEDKKEHLDKLEAELLSLRERCAKRRGE